MWLICWRLQFPRAHETYHMATTTRFEIRASEVEAWAACERSYEARHSRDTVLLKEAVHTMEIQQVQYMKKIWYTWQGTTYSSGLLIDTPSANLPQLTL